jgi:integrase
MFRLVCIRIAYLETRMPKLRKAYMTDIILKQGARILFPGDYEKLRAQMPEYYQIICDAMLLSGMRPIEFERFLSSWYRGSRRVIVLPKDSCLKEKCKFKERTIRLSLAGCDAFDKLTTTIVRHKQRDVPVLGVRPRRVAFRDALMRYAKLAGIGHEGITPKMFRKTLVSWLVACYPEKSLYIQASMGHDGDTIVNNYLGLGFTRDDIELMRSKYLNDWGVTV